MNRQQLLTSMCFGNVCLADKQWLAHGQAGGCQTANLFTPLHSPLLPLLHQCPTQRGQYTHPAFVGQECQESRLLPSSLWLPNKVLSPHLSSHLTPIVASWWFYSPAGRVSGWLCVLYCCTLSAHGDITASVWSDNTYSQKVSCV